MEAYEGAEWVRISDDVPVDEDGRDRALEAFQTSYRFRLPGSVSETALNRATRSSTRTRKARTRAARTPTAAPSKTEPAEGFGPQQAGARRPRPSRPRPGRAVAVAETAGSRRK